VDRGRFLDETHDQSQIRWRSSDELGSVLLNFHIIRPIILDCRVIRDQSEGNWRGVRGMARTRPHPPENAMTHGGRVSTVVYIYCNS
jgi:hypothetical protein